MKIILVLLIAFKAYAVESVKSVSVKKLAQTEIFDEYSYPAVVEAEVKGHLLADKNGIVTNVYKKLGDPVVKGTKILKLKNSDPVYNYRPIDIKSPIDGVISELLITEGESVIANQKIAHIINPLLKKIVIHIPYKDSKYFKPGMKGELFDRNSKKYLSVKIQAITPIVSNLTGTQKTELVFDNIADAASVNIGAISSVRFKSNFHKGIIVADEAIFFEGPKTFVRIVKDSKAFQREITIGQKRKGQVEILKGLEFGETVIERVSGFVKEGETVAIQGEGKADAVKK